MPAVVRRLADADLDAVVVFAVRAWAPVFDSMRAVLGEVVYRHLYPDFQRRGIADLLTRHALDAMRQAGLRLAVVATGGDPGHAPARAAYEKAGFTGLPLVRYYQAL